MPDSLTDTSKVPLAALDTPLPSFPTNLAESEGSPLIHASESTLNQPLIKREHAEVSGNVLADLPPHTHTPIRYQSQTKQKETGLACLRSHPPPPFARLKSGLVVGPSLI